MTQSELINEDDNKLLNMVDMLISIAHSKISCCRVWLRINRHQEEDFRIDEIMQVMNEEMLNAEKTLTNPFWRLNSEEASWSYTDEKRFKYDWMIQYLLNSCKFTVTAPFLLLNLSLTVMSNTLSTLSVKSVRNVAILRVLCRVIHDGQTHKVWKSAKKVIKYQVLTEHIVYLIIRDTDFKITDQFKNSSWDVQSTCKYHILNVSESLITETKVVWLIDFQMKDMCTAYAVKMCNNHCSWLYQTYVKWWTD